MKKHIIGINSSISIIFSFSLTCFASLVGMEAGPSAITSKQEVPLIASAPAAGLLPDEENPPILCVEVGWQRIKAAVLPSKMTYAQLKTIRTIAFPSGIWLTHNFPLLFKKMLANPLTPLLEQPHTKVSLAISGPVIDRSIHPDFGRRGIPVQLKEACEQQAHCEVIVENDVVCWAIGTQEYLKLKSQPLKYPYLTLTCGTAVGAALTLNEKEVYGIELTYIDCPFSRLKFLTREQPFSSGFNPHRALGKPYFDWKLGKREFSDKEAEPYLFNYNNRFYAFVIDFVEALERLFSVKINNILVGGGYSRFIKIPEEYSTSMILLKPQSLLEEGISPDVLQLLGCQQLANDNSFMTFIYPPFEDIQKMRKRRTSNAAQR